MQKITPCLWFDFDAEEAVDLYLSLFKDGKILEVSRYNNSVPEHAGKVLTIRFNLGGSDYLALNGGPQFPHSEAFSFSVECVDQAEVDRLWTALTADGGSESQCGWLKDRFGVSWQIVPEVLARLLTGGDPERAARMMGAMFQMKKLDIAALEAAYHG